MNEIIKREDGTRNHEMDSSIPWLDLLGSGYLSTLRND